MREQNVQREGASSQPAKGPATSGGGRGVQLKKEAAQAGDVAAQEAALKPGGGLLTPKKVDDALGYNGRRAKRQGEAFIKGLQGLVGAPVSGGYDAPTVQSVAKYQDDAGGLRVDGKVGPKTEKDLGPKLAAPDPKKEAEAPQNAGDAPKVAAPEVAKPKPTDADKNAPAPDPVAAAAPTVEPAPKQDEDAKAGDAPADVKSIVARLDAALMPIALFEADKLSLGTLSTWPKERASALADAIAAYAKLPAGADRTSLEQALARTAKLVAGVLSPLGKQVRDHSIKLVNDATVLKDPKQQPVLPDLASVRAYQAGLRALGATTGDALVSGSGLKVAVEVAQDGALALFQGLSVLAARETWKQGVVEPGADGVKAANSDKDNPLKRIFKETGSYLAIGTATKKRKDGTKYKKVADWCGMFVTSHLFRGGGLDQELRAGFLHVDNVIDYFNYTQAAKADRVPKSVWADGEWHELKDYHGIRGSVRKWTPRSVVKSTMEGGGGLDVRPGDVVLIDHSGTKSSPQHITMVESYDPKSKILTTIEGNTGGIQAPDGKVKGEDGEEHWMRHKGADGSGVHTRDLGDMGKPGRKAKKGQAYKGRAGSTVFAIGRPSVVDFEEHSFATRAVPADMKKMSPEEMRELAQKKGKEAKKARRADVHKPQ